jgi:hypothetical protein
LKHFIESKTKNLNEILVVKGKLEMLKNTYTAQDKYWKIKGNIKKMKKGNEEDQMLTY